MKDNENVQDFFYIVSKKINQIRSYGDIITNKKVKAKILRCLLGNLSACGYNYRGV